MPRAAIVGAILICGLGLGGLGYTRVMARVATITPPDMQAPEAQADAVIVAKSARRLVLLRQGRVIGDYPISLGRVPKGAKTREGDERTPEGVYRIDWRNPRSAAYLSLHISYPDDTDRARAAARGEAPGGNIMIHGLPNGWGALGGLHRLVDWTDGCIGVTNAEMREIWARVPDGTPVTLTP